jgi:hypothetical protein
MIECVAHALKKIVGPTNVDVEHVPPTNWVLTHKRWLYACASVMKRGIRWLRTLIYGPDHSSVGYEDVEVTKVGDGGGDGLLRLLNIPYVGRESEHPCRGLFTQDLSLARFECFLLTPDNGQGSTSACIKLGRF